MNVKSFVSAIALLGASFSALPACSTAAAVAAGSARADESAARISAGMTRLGASQERSDCFAHKIASTLNAPDADEAIGIIDTSTSKEDMRDGVLGASASVKRSFIRAHFGCS